MVLGEFSEAEKGIIFSDLELRKMLIKHIQKKGVNEAEDVIINLALEFLLETLEESKLTELGQDRITAIKETYLAVNYEFIKNNISYEIEDPDSVDVPEEVIDKLKDSYEEYLAKPSENPKLTYEEFKATIYNLGKAEVILMNAKENLTAKAVELEKDRRRIDNIEAKIEELQKKLL